MEKELTEIRGILSEFKEEILSSLEHQFSMLDYKFNMLNNSFENLDKKNNDIEDDIRKLQLEDLNHQLNCPQYPKIKDLKNRVEILEKEDTRQESIKKFLNRILIVAASLFGFILTANEIYKLFTGKS